LGENVECLDPNDPKQHSNGSQRDSERGKNKALRTLRTGDRQQPELYSEEEGKKCCHEIFGKGAHDAGDCRECDLASPMFAVTRKGACQNSSRNAYEHHQQERRSGKLKGIANARLDYFRDGLPCNEGSAQVATRQTLEVSDQLDRQWLVNAKLVVDRNNLLWRGGDSGDAEGGIARDKAHYGKRGQRQRHEKHP
jgi:hypothetical protein